MQLYRIYKNGAGFENQKRLGYNLNLEK